MKKFIISDNTIDVIIPKHTSESSYFIDLKTGKAYETENRGFNGNIISKESAFIKVIDAGIQNNNAYTKSNRIQISSENIIC